MKVDYIAFDSFGIKSSCILIETADVKICVDPGIAIETGSFPLSLTKRLALEVKYKRKIKKACKQADVIAISHYHYDHHIPETSLYKNKHLLIKDPKKNINKSQKERASEFLSLVKDKAKKIEIADGKQFIFGKTKIKFSKPLWHGIKGTNLGKVIMVTVEDKNKNEKIKKILYSSDIDGPYIKNYSKAIVKESPDLIILDGFPSYLLGYLASLANLRKVIKNTIYIIKNSKAKIILDHHLLRDYRYREIYYEVYKKAKELGSEVHTAAEELGKKPAVIEAYKKNGPTRWRSWQAFSFDYLERAIKHAKKVGKKAKKKKSARLLDKNDEQ